MRSGKRSRGHGAVAIAAAGALTLTGCTSGAPDEFASGEGFSIEGALHQIPASALEEIAAIYVADLAGAAGALDLPGPDDDPEEWLLPLHAGETSERAFVPDLRLFGRSGFADSNEIHAELGWSPMDVRAYAQLLNQPMEFAVIDADADLTTASGLVDLGDGVFSAGEAEDYYVNPAETTAARPTGAPLRMGQHDGLTAVAPDTPVLREWLEDDTQTLAQDERLQPLAAALDQEGVLTAALVVAPSWSFEDALDLPPDLDLTNLRAQVESYLPEDPFRTVGIGWTMIDDAPRFTLAYQFDSEEAAEAAIPFFEQQWTDGHSLFQTLELSEMYSLVETRTEGPVAVLSLEIADPDSEGAVMHGQWFHDALQQRDLIFLHQ